MGQLEELIFLDKISATTRIRLLLVLALVSIGFGVLTLHLQSHFARLHNEGQQLNLVTNFLANGSSGYTVWPGWAAAFFFFLAVLWLYRIEPEPPLSLTKPPQTIGEIRNGFRKEYKIIRVALIAILLVTILDIGRAAVYVISALRHDPLARSVVAYNALEAVGLVLAAVALGFWVHGFRSQLIRLGVL